MKTVFDQAFLPYGRPVTDVPTDEVMRALAGLPMPEEGMTYSPREDALHACLEFEPYGERLYADMPYQLGYCAGENESADTMVRHGGSAFVCGESEFTLAVRHRWESETERFTVPAGQLTEIYGDTLRSAPLGRGFRVLVILPFATNTDWQGADGAIFRNTWKG